MAFPAVVLIFRVPLQPIQGQSYFAIQTRNIPELGISCNNDPKPVSAASVKSRSIRARRPSNSCLLVVCSCALRCASSCIQLILRSLNHNHLLVQNRQKEMVFVLNFLLKFLLPAKLEALIHSELDQLEIEFGQMTDAFADCFRKGDCRRGFPTVRGALDGLRRRAEQIRRDHS